MSNDREPCDDHDEWHPRCEYCRGMFGGTRATTSDPDPDDDRDPDPDRELSPEAVGLLELFGTLAKATDHSGRLEYQIEHGIYDRASLETPEVSIELSMAYCWSRSLDGKYNIDIPHDEIPDDVDLEDCSLAIFSDDGIPLLAGPIVNVGREDGLGGNTTVAIKSGVSR